MFERLAGRFMADLIDDNENEGELETEEQEDEEQEEEEQEDEEQEDEEQEQAKEVEEAEGEGALAAIRDSADQATQVAVKQIIALKEVLYPVGYEMRSLELKLGLSPQLEVYFRIRAGADMSMFQSDQEELTELQRAVILMLRQKAQLDAMVERNGMVFKSLRVILSVPPSVSVRLGFKYPPEPIPSCATAAAAAAANTAVVAIGETGGGRATAGTASRECGAGAGGGASGGGGSGSCGGGRGGPERNGATEPSVAGWGASQAVAAPEIASLTAAAEAKATPAVAEATPPAAVPAEWPGGRGRCSSAESVYV
eukprot:NODE_15479_length_1048_cov_4.095548.p1 GENE.NODE_15479_length_1048_cov_4.095548~~NODE_15479_length_1048_cov_4.095548.p1  ORF type:complete len:348 (-),score=117.24 NODE_15479_length_1048_cov_4.095548:3-938(-)